MTSLEHFDVPDEHGLTLMVELPEGPISESVECVISSRASDADTWVDVARFTVLPGTLTLRQVDHFLRHVRFHAVAPGPKVKANIIRIVPRNADAARTRLS